MMPAVVEASMRMLCSSLAARLPDTVESVCVYGSTALGAYVEGSSDIDFIAVVKRTLSEEDFALIAEVHKKVESAWPGSDPGGYIIRSTYGCTIWPRCCGL